MGEVEGGVGEGSSSITSYRPENNGYLECDLFKQRICFILEQCYSLLYRVHYGAISNP